ncbi:MAG TPA: tetratricopeptide repeat protein, partial [Gemmataceae bacterium]|nr:tetratricopeptide repeat protein [Gemmataceae bacterium]
MAVTGLMFLAEMNPGDVSLWTGRIMAMVGLCAGIWKCLSIARRPTTNAKCALALALVLATGIPICLVSSLEDLAGDWSGARVVVVLAGLAVMILCVAAIALGIMGLVELSQRRGCYIQGRAQAIWALTLAGFTGISVCAGFVSALVVAGKSEPVAAAQTRPGKLLTFDDLNFRFRAPSRPWVSVQAAKLNKDSKVSYMRRFPDSYFIVIAEDLGGGTVATSEQLAELGKAHMQATAVSAQVLNEGPLKLSGLDGVSVKSEAVVGKYKAYYEQWFCVTNGYGYQLMGWGESKNRQRISRELQQMFQCFEVMDAKRTAPSPGRLFTTNFVSRRYGYEAQVANSKWHASPALQKSFPEAEFRASMGDSCVVVLPVWLRNTPIENDALYRGLLSSMTIDYPNENLNNREPVKEGELTGDQFDFERDIDSTTYHYRLRLLRGHGCGYLMAAWTRRREAEMDPIMKDALERVKFSAAAVPALSTNVAFSEQELKNQGNVLNQAGLFCFNANDFDKALPLFRAALDVKKEEIDSAYLQNALLCWCRLQRPREGLDFLESQPARILAQPEFRAFQAYFQAGCSKTEEALTNYAAVFAAGYRDEDDFKFYVGVLTDQHQYERALDEVARYLKAGDSLEVRLLTATIYRDERDFEKAVAFLKGEHQKTPFNSKITKALVETCLDAELPSEALSYSRELIKSSGNTASTLYLKGQCELKLKWYRDAKASLEEAAKLAPADEDIRSELSYVSGL